MLCVLLCYALQTRSAARAQVKGKFNSDPHQGSSCKGRRERRLPSKRPTSHTSLECRRVHPVCLEHRLPSKKGHQLKRLSYWELNGLLSASELRRHNKSFKQPARLILGLGSLRSRARESTFARSLWRSPVGLSPQHRTKSLSRENG